jgi:hypothetical protein
LDEPPATPVDADADGFFDLGRHRERSAWQHAKWSFVFRSDARVDVVAAADSGIVADTTFVGAAPRLAVLVAHVTRPDGTPVDPSTARIVAKCVAVRCAWDAPADAWRSVPVRVTVTCDGFEPLAFEWTAATADTPRVLVPKSPK